MAAAVAKVVSGGLNGPPLPPSLAVALSLPLFLLSGGKSNWWRFSEKVGKKKVERWKALVPPEEPDRDRQTHIHEIVGLRGSLVFTRH